MPIPDSELRAELNRRTPGYSIVRFPETQPIEKIPLAYWSNMADLQEFINSTMNQPKNALGTAQNFQQFILSCHKIAVTGKDGSRRYSGVSKHHLEPWEIGNFRMEGLFPWGSMIPFPIRKHLRRVAEIYDDQELVKLWRKSPITDEKVIGDDPYFRWILPENATQPSIPSEFFSGLESSEKVIARNIHSSLTQDSELRNFGMLIRSHWGIETVFHIPPTNIFTYLERIREDFRNLVQEKADIKKLHLLGDIYRKGAICQPPHTVWNSINMSIVQRILEEMNILKVSHGYLDFEALLMDPDIFKKRFTDYVTNVH